MEILYYYLLNLPTLTSKSLHLTHCRVCLIYFSSDYCPILWELMRKTPGKFPSVVLIRLLWRYYSFHYKLLSWRVSIRENCLRHHFIRHIYLRISSVCLLDIKNGISDPVFSLHWLLRHLDKIVQSISSRRYIFYVQHIIHIWVTLFLILSYLSYAYFSSSKYLNKFLPHFYIYFNKHHVPLKSK